MNILRILILLFTVSSCMKAEAQEKIFSMGEELNYIVKYGFIELGEVRIRTEDIRNENGNTVIKATCSMRSFDGVPLVSLDSRFESTMIYNGTELYSTSFNATDKKDEGVVVIRYDFNYDSGFVKVFKQYRGVTEIDKKMEFDKKLRFQDGLSLFYQARLNSFNTESHYVPVFMNEAETSVKYFFSAVPEEISLDELDMDCLALKCSGNANFVGVFGLTGEFAGWFSNDPQRIPLLAKMNVIIGNITLELDAYRRDYWKPEAIN